MPITLTDAGLQILTVDEIRAELNAAYTDPSTGVSPLLDVSDDSEIGRMIAIDADRERNIQEQIAAVLAAAGPDATGIALTRVALLTGTIRADATYSTVVGYVTLNAGVTLPTGAQANVAGDPDSVFETIEDVTNPGGSPAIVLVDMRAVNPGSVRAPYGTLTEITTPFSGWTSVTNDYDAEVGNDDETDPTLRVRRVVELNRAASANIIAIQTAVRSVNDVISARGYENTTASTNGDGLPPHSFEIVVYGTEATDSDIAQAIWDDQPSSIAAVHGTAGTTASGIATDTEGDLHTITFTRATEVPIYADLVLLTNSDYPADGDDIVKQAVADYINAQTAIGNDIIYSRLFGAVYGSDAAVGIDDVTTLEIGVAPAPSGTSNIAIGSRAVPTSSVSNITVVS
ncbi:MAG: hypothetical protein RL701_5994 [Pseudomonadota bacterium]|jgi:uncharacterized phage protein gp47/JayE